MWLMALIRIRRRVYSVNQLQDGFPLSNLLSSCLHDYERSSSSCWPYSFTGCKFPCCLWNRGMLQDLYELFVHMYRKHRTTLELSLTAQAQSETIDTMQTSILECENSDDDALMDVSIDFKKRHSALLLLKMKQTYKMSEIAVDSIISDISLLLQNRTDELRLQLCDKVPTHEEKINEVFNSPQLPFCGLETKYLRHRYFVNTLKLQVSDMHIL